MQDYSSLQQGRKYQDYRKQKEQNLAANIALINNDPFGKLHASGKLYASGKDLVEGFAGIVEPTDANQRNEREYKKYQQQQAELQRKLSSHAMAHQNLMDSTHKYIRSASSTKNKNFNMLINKHPRSEDIQVTAEGCFLPASSLVYQMDLGTNVSEEVCKIRAYDINSTVYGLSNTGGCYVGDNLDAAKSNGPLMKSVISKSFKRSGSANVAQLFQNGQLGIYDKSTAAQRSENNVMTDIPASGTCNMYNGGNINVTSATYGGNCNNYTDPDPMSTIRSGVRQNFCLQPSPPKFSGYSGVEAWDCMPGNPKQNLTYDPDSKRIAFGNTGQCMDVFGARTSQGTPLLKYPCHNGANQKWNYDEKTQSLRPQHAPEMCLDVMWGSGQNGAPLWIYGCNNSPAQKWTMSN